MSVGVWLVPIALASIGVLLWAAARVEDLLVSRTDEAKLSKRTGARSAVVVKVTSQKSR